MTFHDLRFAIKSLRRSPGFTLIAVITLGLGIGANTAAFTLVNEVLLRPLPYPESEQLERIYRATPQNARGGFSPADYLDLKAAAGGFGEVAAYMFVDMSLSAPGEPALMASGLRISENLLSVLGIRPALGRDFRPEEVAEGHRVLIISDRCWRTRFGGDAGILGRTVHVDGETYEIVGVMPAAMDDWRHLGAVDLFRPLGLSASEKADRTSSSVRLIGRRSAALSRAQADGSVTEMGRRLAAQYPAVHAGTTWRTLALNVATAPENGPPLFAMLIGLSGFVLLIACSNLANLLLVRTIGRARELAVRAALGASRARLLAPLFVESLLLALAGGAAAIGFAAWSNGWMRYYMNATATSTGQQLVFALDWRVLAWAFGVGLLTVVAFGVAPAHFALRLDLNRTLKSGGRGQTGDRGHRRFRYALIVGQFALALVLLAGAAVFARGVHEVNGRRYGWETEKLASGTLALPAARYGSGEEITRFHRRAVEGLEALPGVASASVSWSMPFFGLSDARKYVVAGAEAPAPGHEPVAVTCGVTPRYFETVGTSLREGRVFDDGDTAASPRVFVVNEAMARGLFGGQPLGRRIARAGGKTLEWGEIVGVVEDIQSVMPDEVPVAFQLYQPMAQEPRPSGHIAVRSSSVAPAALVGGIRGAVTGLDPDLPLRELEPAEATIERANFQWGIVGTWLYFLAAMGLGLASLGMYSVISRTMAQRTSEFGIRLALGAQVGDIVRLVLASGAKLAVAGSALGLLGALGIARLLASIFPGMHTNSAPVLAAATVLLVGIALLACYMPARSASRISPVEALRAE